MSREYLSLALENHLQNYVVMLRVSSLDGSPGNARELVKNVCHKWQGCLMYLEAPAQRMWIVELRVLDIGFSFSISQYTVSWVKYPFHPVLWSL